LNRVLSNIIVSIFIITLCGSGLAQSSYLHQKSVLVDNCTIVKDSFSIIPSSVNITFETDTIGRYNVENGYINLDSISCQKWTGSLLEIEYRTFDFNIEDTKFLFDTSQLTKKERIVYIGYDLDPYQSRKSNEIIDEKDLNYSGSFSRGFSVGNAQSLVLNSNFDLQLNGKMGGGLDIVAAISDDNIPIQPEGNTQLIQDFDRVFIKVSKDKTAITAGDYEINRPIGYFQNYFKKIKGLKGETTIENENNSWTTSANIAISRGKFARQEMITKEGNQGPYRLQGNNGERFLQVLSGTEKIYFNGVLLKRGFDLDYVIDYNRAEITFSPTRSIRQDSRVIAEFEYTDQNYQRSQYTLNTLYENNKSNFYVNFYSEQDSKTTTSQIELDSIDKSILALSGDDFNAASRSGIRVLSDEESVSSIRYKLVENDDFPIDPNELKLVFSTNLDSAIYVSSFSEVGVGLGSYSIDNKSIVNGRVYKFVGFGNGNYEPIIKLIPPEKRQITSLGGSYNISQKGKVFGEFSFSDFDLNRLSAINNDDNKGLAAYIGIEQSWKLDTAGHWNLNTDAKLEMTDADFRFLNPYRNTEFTRDWNLTGLLDPENQVLSISEFRLRFKNEHLFKYALNTFSSGNSYDGVKNYLSLKSRIKDFQILANYNTLSSKSITENTSFIRPNIELSQTLKSFSNVKISTYFEEESNKKEDPITSKLLAGSRSYQFYKGFVESDVNKPFYLKIGANKRLDKYLNDQSNSLENTLESEEIEIVNGINTGEHLNLNWTLLKRNFKVLNEELAESENTKSTLLGRLDMNLSLLKRSIITSTNYSLGSGQEPKVEYFFEKVENNQGEYLYVGEGADTATVFNISDFRYDPTNPQANFIRLSLFNNEFIITDNLDFNQSIRWEPKNMLDRKVVWQKYLSKLAFSSSIRINKKKESVAGSDAINPLDFSVSDPNLTSYSSQLLNTIFINRGEVAYDLQLAERRNDGRSNLINGLETRELKERSILSRVNIVRNFDLNADFLFGSKSYTSQLFESRNFDIKYYGISPKISYRPSNSLRFISSYSYNDRKQTILNKEKSNSHEFSLEMSKRSASSASLDCSFSFVKVNYTGEANIPIEYDLLNGLKNGNNYLWRLNFIKRISQSIDLNINYEGRKTGISPTIHVARAQVKASF
jgi:hypothetical protein